METTGNLGWRKLEPTGIVHQQFIADADRNQLYKCKNLAVKALKLSKAQITVLANLISYFKEPLAGRLLVWPSNASIENATGYSERAIRGSIKELIRAGVLLSKDSANGKRFCIRAKTGQILDAYGFDLAPLLAREKEFLAIVKEQEAAAEFRKRQLDEITICRRQVQEVLRAFEEQDSTLDRSDLQDRFDALMAVTPRRSLIRNPDALLADWSSLKELSEHQYHTAFAGKNCRHIENNNEIPEQPCQNGNEEMIRRDSVSLSDLKVACPDAIGYAPEIRTDGDLISAAARLRGVFGTHKSAWEDACEDLGRPRAAATFFLVLQMYDDDQRGKQLLNNFGGLFRSWARKVASEEVDLAREIQQMKRRRQH